MLKFMKHQQKLTPERIQKQRELFAFSKACYHGFPSKPSALAWDPALRLIALATKGSVIRMYGQPGVEVYGQSDRCDAPITRITFLEGQGRLVSLCEDNSLHLWEMKEAKEEEEGGGGGGGRLRLVHIKSTSLEGKLKRISVVVGGGAGSGGQQLMVGTEGGNIYLLDLTSFTMSDNIIYQDVVMQNVPEDYKLNPGPVEAIAVHPKEATRILIGYQRGLVVLWDTKNLCADQTYVSSQQLESVCWHPDAAHFTTSHNDGSYVEWSAVDSSQPSDGPHTVYGPFPCKPITKILRPPANEGQQYIVFSGGMPRASYGDKNTVTVIEGERHVTFSLSSKVLDFVIVKNKDTGVGSSLVVLAEEEVVFIDLETEDWPAFQAPYLASLHSSAITCAYLAAGVLNEVMDKIKDAGRKQHARLSSRPWPVDGGRLPKEEEEEEGKKKKKEQDILLTGHEDGTVQFWDASSVSLQLLYKLSTSQLFVSEDLGGEGAAAEDDDWPPFRKAGLFDPYSDDPRLGVKKMQMCPYTGMLVVAGTAGQVLVMSPSSEAKELTPQATDVNLVADNDSFVWKSHSKLETRTEAVKLEAGMQPTAILQFFPPASCTSLALHSEWGLVACGTAHGFALFDTAQNKNLLARSTLSPLDLASTADEGPMSRRKSLKKSLRESFRRLRRGRSQRKTGGGGRAGATSPPATSPPPSPKEEGKEEKEVGEKVEEVDMEVEEEEAEEVFGMQVVGEGEVELGSGGDTAPLSCPEEEEEEEEEEEDDEDIIEEVNEEVVEKGGSRVSRSRERRGKVEQRKAEEDEVVPFFYYVTPKRFRSAGRGKEEKEKEKEKPEKEKEKDTGKDTKDSKDTGTEDAPKTGLGRLRGWLQRGDSGETEMQKPEGVVEGETKESSLKRLFRRPQSPTPTPDQAAKDTGGPEGSSQVPQAIRPARLWFTRRSQSERRASPISPTPPPVRAVTPQEERRRGLTLPLNLRQPPAAPSPSPAASPIPSPVPIEEGRLKKFFRQQSEVVLRPFTRRQDPAKRRSAPPAPAPPTPPQEVSEIEARHPSINTYIDDTPTTPNAPQIPSPTLPHSPLVPTSVTPTGRRSVDLSPTSAAPAAPTSLPGTLTRKLTFSIPFGSSRGGGGADDEAVKPVERAIEARSSAPDYVGSMVRCLHLTKCFIANNQAMSATLWAGTNSGSIFVFTIAIPPSDKRQEVPLTVQLGKEIHLKHGAPVLGVWVLDGCGQPFPPPMAVKKDVASPPSTTLPHRVLICSEEQFKVFTLPQLKPFCKFKLTAHEGSRARKLDLGEFVSTADSSYSETCLVLATNQGDFSIFSLPDCRRQLYAPYIKKEDISGINSVVFTRRGEALYLASPSELERVSLSARHVTRPRGTVPDVKAVAPLTAKKEGQGQEKGGDTTTATTTTTPPPTTTTTTTTTTTNAAAAAAESAETTTLQLKEQNGEKEETGGKAGGGGGADAAGGGGGGGGEGGGGGRKEEVRENGDNSVLSGDITIDSIRDHMDEVKVAQKVEELCGAVTTTTTTAAAMSESVAVLKAAAITDTTTTTAATATTTTTSSSAISSSQESPSIQLVETTTTITSSSTFSISSSSSTNTTTTTTTVAAAADSATLSIVNGTE